jgi:hypothetical protein
MHHRSLFHFSGLLLAILLVPIISCDPRAKTPMKKITTILESVHDPEFETEGVDHQPQISNGLFLLKSVFNSGGLLVKTEKYNSRGNLEETEVLKYDEKNNLTEKARYRFQKLVSTTKYNYNSANRFADCEEWDGERKLISKQSSRTDSAGRQMLEVFTMGRNRLTKTSAHTYDKNGYNVMNEFFRGNAARKEINHFNGSGDCIEKTEFDFEHQLERTTHFRYDTSHRLVEVVYLDANSLMESKVLRKYNERNLLVEAYTYGLTGMLKEQVKHVYEYDAFGHWVKDAIWVNRKPTSVVVRRIEYGE